MTSTRKIEQLWDALRLAGVPGQRRIDAIHAHDIYADFEPPGQVGLVVVCPTRPEDPRPLRSLTISAGQRTDGRWSLRLALTDRRLEPVFAALCDDVILSTGTGVAGPDLGRAVIWRVEHWRALLERDFSGLGETTLRGLIGELTVLDREIMRRIPAGAAIASWKGPFGAAQDFQLPSGERIEVKAVVAAATSVQINGLGQLEAAGDPLSLAVVRMQATAAAAADVVTAPGLIERLRKTLADDTAAARLFDAALAAARWHDHPSHDAFAVRVLGIDAYVVDDLFPKLTAGSVPAGVLDATYAIALPDGHIERWGDRP